MFNTYDTGDTNVKINAISGTIVKNYKDSFMEYIILGSGISNKLFDKNPTFYNGHYYKPVVVLQAMMCGEKSVLCELMWKKDFDKLFEN